MTNSFQVIFQGFSKSTNLAYDDKKMVDGGGKEISTFNQTKFCEWEFVVVFFIAPVVGEQKNHFPFVEYFLGDVYDEVQKKKEKKDDLITIKIIIIVS